MLGVDLGFADNGKHHSTQSGYYDEQGKQLYDYAEKNNTSLVVPGNFRATCFTKQEFKIAKMVMEQSLASSKTECYNTSDGANIIGSLSLHSKDILLMTDRVRKQICIENMRKKCFVSKSQESFTGEYNTVFSEEILAKEMSMLRQKLMMPVENFEQAEQLIETQKRMLFASYQHSNSLLFYFLYGTVNYANVVFNKVAYSFDDGEFSVNKFNQARELWSKYLKVMSDAVECRFSEFDSSSSLYYQRITLLIREGISRKKILIVSDSNLLEHLKELLSRAVGFEINFVFLTGDDFLSDISITNNFDFVIFQIETDFDSFNSKVLGNIDSLNSKTDIIFTTSEIMTKDLLSTRPSNVHFYVSPVKYTSINSPPESHEFCVLHRVVLYLLDYNKFDFLIPKYTFSESFDIDRLVSDNDYDGYHFYDLGYTVGAKSKMLDSPSLQLFNGTRAGYEGKEFKERLITRQVVSDIKLKELNIKNLEYFPSLEE